MLRPRTWVAWWLPLLLSSVFAACGDGDGPVKSALRGGAGAGGEAEPSQEGGEGGGLGGGGQSSSAAGASAAGEAGAHLRAEGGATGSAGGEGEGAGAGGLGVTGEQLSLCARLSLQTTRATRQSAAFAAAIYSDCRVSWLVPLGPDLDDYRQQLAIWNLELWGCQGAPVTTLGLVWGTPSLSAGDVSVLVEAYLVATDAPKAELGLSPAEYEEMKSALERLARPYVADSSTEASNPSCEDGGGGAGGHGGAGGAP